MKKILLSFGLLLALMSAAGAQTPPASQYVIAPSYHPSRTNGINLFAFPEFLPEQYTNLAIGKSNQRLNPQFGIALESLVYPAPVKFLLLEIEGQSVRMAYMDVVSPSGPNGRTVVLLHGKNFGGDYWQDTIFALARAGYRVIVPDQIGFGKSSKPDINYSFDLLAANTAKLLDELKIERAAVVGHSMGGMLAVRFARNYPTRVSRLVLENPIGLEDYRFAVSPQTTEQQFQRELKNTDSQKITAFYRNYFVSDKVNITSLAAPRIGVTQSGEYPRWAKAAALTYQMIYQQPVRHEFSLLRVPTLLVIGQEDRTAIGKDLVSSEIAKTLGNYPALGKAAERDIPNAQLLELPNIGHIPHIEAANVFHASLLKFLQ
jgi:pimeloyl-ACP methyl ester carboxylesterase